MELPQIQINVFHKRGRNVVVRTKETVHSKKNLTWNLHLEEEPPWQNILLGFQPLPGVPTPWVNVFPFFTLPKSTQTDIFKHLKTSSFSENGIDFGGLIQNCGTEGTSEFSWILNFRLGHLVSETPARLHPWSSGSFTHQWYQQKNNVERRSLRDGHPQKRLYIV